MSAESDSWGGNWSAPKGNSNASKHDLYADPAKVRARQAGEQAEFIEEVKQAILNRIEQNRSLDLLDFEVAEMIAARLLIVMRASKYLQGRDLESNSDVMNVLRLHDARLFDDLGLLDREDEQADVLDLWRQFIEPDESGSELLHKSDEPDAREL